MPDPRHDQLRRLFAEALELRGDARAHFLDTRCAGDVELRTRLRAMLAAASDDHFLGGPPLEARKATEGAAAPALEGPGAKIGHYKLLQQIGEGGFGVVYMAEQTAPVARKVALKLLKLGMDTRQVVARFEQERQALALMDHPHIARVFDAGATESGRPYFVMELVKGEPIVAYCDRHQLTVDERLALFADVCGAVEHAHSKGIIHRDLKPNNILVGPVDGRPHAKVIDFGIAKATAEKLTDKTLFTEHHQVIGSLQYMSPEQAEGSLDIDTRSDVYALGAVLYELLTGTTPFEAKTINAALFGELQRLIREVDPPKPSTRISSATATLASVAALRRVAPKRLGSLVRGELDWIVMKALEKDRKRRYQTATSFAEDIRRHLGGEAVLAVPPSRLYQLQKLVRRHKLVVGATLAVTAALAVGMAGFAWQSRIAAANAARANQQEQLATARAEDVLSLSAIQQLEELRERADTLWPATPQNLAAYEAWLGEAEQLVLGRAADLASGRARVPGLADHEAKLAELRARAMPRSAERVAADLAQNPHRAAFEADSGRLLWMRRMLGSEPWPDEATVLAALAAAPLPGDAAGLRARATPLIDNNPATVTYGREVEGVLLAQRALAAAGDDERAVSHHTLARALWRVGRFEEASAEAARAVAATPAALRADQERRQVLLEQGIAEWAEPNQRAARAKEVEALALQVEEQRSRMEAWRTYEFADPRERWWHTQLERLIEDLRAFKDPSRGVYSDGVSPAHGAGIVRRQRFAASILERSVAGADAKARWDAAIAAVAASPRYAGLRLAPQLGLVPIGADPTSGLWEFAHLESGEPAVRRADGSLEMLEATGLVLVLIPAGEFDMGAQSSDPAGPNFDLGALPYEAPVHRVALSAFFLSKFELTQAQWERVQGENPSYYKPGKRVQFVRSLLHPVEQVSWDDCVRVLGRMALSLPSEAQWEYGARGGTQTVWWTGDDRESLRGAVNLADRTAGSNGAPWSDIQDWPDLEDGFVMHAPVDSHRANGFGLHGVHGNVWEWCLDGFDNGFYRQSPRQDPVSPPSGSASRVNRGGCFATAAASARAANRPSDAPTIADRYLGVRPARAIETPR